MFFVWALAVAGLSLIFLEFFLPGAIMAIGGSVLLLTSLYVFYKVAPDPLLFIGYLGLLVLLVFLVIRLALWRVKSTAKKGTIYLMSDQEGYQASIYPKEMVGKKGVAASDLKPSGHIFIEEAAYQALSKSGYIDKGTPVEILGGQGSHLIVKPIEPSKL